MQWMNGYFQTIKSNAIGWDGSFFELVKMIKQILYKFKIFMIYFTKLSHHIKLK